MGFDPLGAQSLSRDFDQFHAFRFIDFDLTKLFHSKHQKFWPRTFGFKLKNVPGRVLAGSDCPSWKISDVDSGVDLDVDANLDSDNLLTIIIIIIYYKQFLYNLHKQFIYFISKNDNISLVYFWHVFVCTFLTWIYTYENSDFISVFRYFKRYFNLISVSRLFSFFGISFEVDRPSLLVQDSQSMRNVKIPPAACTYSSAHHLPNPRHSHHRGHLCKEYRWADLTLCCKDIFCDFHQASTPIFWSYYSKCPKLGFSFVLDAFHWTFHWLWLRNSKQNRFLRLPK